MQALCLNVEVLAKTGEEIEMRELDETSSARPRSSASTCRGRSGPTTMTTIVAASPVISRST
ncbi:MAG: hypothetical protein WKF43_14280 [Acidimicrobiales bacterium]